MTNYARPDEMATESEIRKAQARTNEVRSTLESIGSFGTTAAGAKIASKVIPFLSQYIPEDLALKGINKVVPGLGSFLKNGMSQGLSLKSGLNFLKGEFSKQKDENPDIQPQADKNRNLIEKHSPELHQFISEELKKGRSLAEVAGLSLLVPKKNFKPIIEKIKKENKAGWEEIVESVYGASNSPQSLPATAPNSPQTQMLSAGQPQQMGAGQQAFMQVMEKLNQRFGK